MRFRLEHLRLALQRGVEVVGFADFSYFYGQMGAGKTSIARLADFCLGGSLELSPALQSEFVAATLAVHVGDTRLELERLRDSDQVRASWSLDGDHDVILPARTPGGEVMRGTGVEVLSDLIFSLAGMQPPRVRRSKLREDSELARLSFRDLLWYCYLDQDEIDSSFFHLDLGAHPFKRLKSRDVLRFLVGFHQERVAELESELEDTRIQRTALQVGAAALQSALDVAGVRSEAEIEGRINELEAELRSLNTNIEEARATTTAESRTHGVEVLREQGRLLADEIAALADAILAIESTLAGDRRHLHELEVLGLKVQRSFAARAVLAGVEFEACPRCAQALPERSTGSCRLCGQDERPHSNGDPGADVLAQDAKARISELRDVIERHEIQLERSRARMRELNEEKVALDRDLSAALQEYDSLYLSTTLMSERRRATVAQQISSLGTLRQLPRAVTEQRERAAALAGREAELRAWLVEIRKAAERDTRSLDRLASLFLDCLVRAKVPGIRPSDIVVIRPPTFLPEVQSADLGDLAVTSFANLSSGGKKTLFKCCFALAVHRLATETGAALPEFMLIDSPMKNISERENREQFEGFHQLLYDLKTSELASTQFVLIDKEYAAPNSRDVEVVARHMTPEDPRYPPLIPYYRGH